MPLAGLNTAPALARLIDGLHRLEVNAVAGVGRDDLLGWPSFTPTVIQAPFAGVPQLNVMPGKAQVLVDVRTVSKQSHSAIRDDLTALASEVQNKVRDHYRLYDRRLDLERDLDLQVKVEFLTDRACTFTDPSDPIVLAADWATRRVYSGEPIYAGVPGATDGTFLWARKNIPIVTMGAGERHVPHQVNEWVDLDQLIETARIYALTALHYLFPGQGR
jgi:succinyl-diaminopimelate desuccinylase